MTLAQTERHALADLFGTLGPDQPTLCEGWNTKDLLIHLIVRDGRPDVAIGKMVKPLAGHADKVEADYAARPWVDLIEVYRSGPPGWNPMGWGKVDELANGGEMFIHHEDARRGQPDWKPRVFDSATTATLADMVDSGMSKLMLRKSSVGVQAKLPTGQTVELKKGPKTVTLSGEPGEILLYLSGRRAAEVELSGDPDGIAAFGGVKKGF
jgi:uncharacterized protein (TIGR03085 family)